MKKAAFSRPTDSAKRAFPNAGDACFRVSPALRRWGQVAGRVWRPSSSDIYAAVPRKPFGTRRPNRIPLPEFCLVPPTSGYPLRGLTPAVGLFLAK